MILKRQYPTEPGQGVNMIVSGALLIVVGLGFLAGGLVFFDVGRPWMYVFFGVGGVFALGGMRNMYIGNSSGQSHSPRARSGGRYTDDSGSGFYGTSGGDIGSSDCGSSGGGDGGSCN